MSCLVLKSTPPNQEVFGCTLLSLQDPHLCTVIFSKLLLTTFVAYLINLQRASDDINDAVFVHLLVSQLTRSSFWDERERPQHKLSFILPEYALLEHNFIFNTI